MPSRRGMRKRRVVQITFLPHIDICKYSMYGRAEWDGGSGCPMTIQQLLISRICTYEWNTICVKVQIHTKLLGLMPSRVAMEQVNVYGNNIGLSIAIT